MMVVWHLEKILSPVNFSTKLHPLQVIGDLLRIMMMLVLKDTDDDEEVRKGDTDDDGDDDEVPSPPPLPQHPS